MNLLAIDTSTEACSVALLMSSFEGEATVVSRYEVQPRKHGELILPMVREVLANAGLSLSQVDAFAFARGPGAFTGLRIAAGIVQGLAWGADRPVLAVSTLAAMAARAARELGSVRVNAAIDARMGEIYWGCFQIEQGEPRLLGQHEHVLAPDKLAVMTAALPAALQADWVGSGAPMALAQLPLAKPAQVNPMILPHASDVARLAQRQLDRGEYTSAGMTRPVYLRDDVVQVKVPVTKAPR